MYFARSLRIFAIFFAFLCVLPLIVSSMIVSRMERYHGVSLTIEGQSRREPTLEKAFATVVQGNAAGSNIKTCVWVKEHERDHLISKHRLRTIFINGQKRSDIFTRPWTIDARSLPAGLIPIEIRIPKGKEQFQAALAWTRDYVEAENIPANRLFVEPVTPAMLYADQAAVWLGIAGRLNIFLSVVAIAIFAIARKSNWKIRFSAYQLVFFVLLAFVFFVRFNGIGCQLTEGLHPDERAAQNNAAGYRMGHLHPKTFLYPPGFHYMMALLDFTLSWVFQHPIPPHLAGRLLSATFGSLTCVVVFSIARALFSPSVGLMAMLFLGFSFMPVIIAHSGIIEPTMVFFFLLAVRSMLEWNEQSPSSAFFLSGLAAGAALGVKQTSVFIVIPFLSMWLWTFRGRVISSVSILRVVVWGGGVLTAYFALSPFSLIDFRNFIHDNLFQFRAVSGDIITAEFFKGVQHGPGLILKYLVDGMGWPIIIAAAAGCIFILKASTRGAVLLLPFSIIYFAICSLVRTPPYHYPLLLCPFLAILAACCLDRLPFFRYRPFLTAVAAILLMVPTLWKTIQLQQILQGTDNRTKTVVWCYQNLPRNSRIDYEFFGPRFLMPLFQNRMVELFHRGPFEEYFRLHRPDYYILDSSTSGLFLKGGENAYPVENEWYRLLRMNADVVQEFSGATMGLFNPRIQILRMHEKFKIAG